ncbi:MAG: hypothetical protein Q7T97_04360 [Burkholderiaceae bacterium]|nr:hypothetical protein [Burkholderiaceae bacterium]
MNTDLFENDLFPVDLAATVHPCAESQAPAALLTTHEHIGFELGWDHAHYGVTPPAPYAQEPSPLRHGWLAGEATFGVRTLKPTASVRQWLQLRLHAWLRGRSVELFQVTPNYLQRIDVSHCPITREVLGNADGERRESSIDRVRNDAGYAAGNLVMMSTRACVAKAAYRFEGAQAMARRLEADHERGNNAPVLQAGLSAVQWSRIAVLCSFVEPLPHARACELPLLVLPPTRLRLFNPVQALQAFISQQLLSAGWSQRINAIEALLPGQPARRAFRSFFQTLLPRVLESGRPGDAQRARWAVEDAWRHTAVLSRWVRFALLLTPAQCESLLSRAAAQRLVPDGLRLEPLNDSEATDGWCLASRGYVPHGLRRQPSTRAMSGGSARCFATAPRRESLQRPRSPQAMFVGSQSGVKSLGL